jgi:hypothetical protein
LCVTAGNDDQSWSDMSEVDAIAAGVNNNEAFSPMEMPAQTNRAPMLVSSEEMETPGDTNRSPMLVSSEEMEGPPMIQDSLESREEIEMPGETGPPMLDPRRTSMPEIGDQSSPDGSREYINTFPTYSIPEPNMEEYITSSPYSSSEPPKEEYIPSSVYVTPSEDKYTASAVEQETSEQATSNYENDEDDIMARIDDLQQKLAALQDDLEGYLADDDGQTEQQW